MRKASAQTGDVKAPVGTPTEMPTHTPKRFLSSPQFAFVGLIGGDGRVMHLRITTEIGQEALVAPPAFADDPFLLELFRTRNPQKTGGRVAPGRCHPETGTVRVGVCFQPGRGEGVKWSPVDGGSVRTCVQIQRSWYEGGWTNPMSVEGPYHDREEA